MRLGIAACLAMVCVWLTFGSAAHAQAADEGSTGRTTGTYAPDVESVSSSVLDPALGMGREYEDGMIVAFTGLALLIAGAILFPIALLLPAFVRDSSEPALGTAIGLVSVGLVLDVTGIVLMLDGIAHAPMDQAHYPL